MSRRSVGIVFVESFFGSFGIRLGFVWDSFGIRLGFVWDSFGIRRKLGSPPKTRCEYIHVRSVKNIHVF